jgi:dienelactone hydrolase
MQSRIASLPDIWNRTGWKDSWRRRASALLLLFYGSMLATGQTSDGPASSRLPRTNLLVFHGKHGEVRPVRSKADWQKRRAEILRGMQEIVGPLPAELRRNPPALRREAEADCGSYVRRFIWYESEPGSSVPAYLLIPKEALRGKKKFPAVLALHPTDMRFGHRVLVEQVNQNYRVYANELAERGFVVLAPAYPIMANYQPDLKALGCESGTMKAIWDNIRGLDLLDSLRFVRRGGYGALGHSLGGHNAIYTAVFDQRIKVIVSSCGFDSFLDYYGGDPKNWQPERGWCQTRYMPKLAEYRGRLPEIPFDFHELIGALAPRPVFINAPLGDSNFKAGSVDEIVKAASAVYRLYRAEKDLTVEHPDCGHDFPEVQREQSYRLLEETLR